MSVVELVPCAVPAHARRVGGTPRPRIRPLADVLPASAGPTPAAPPDCDESDGGEPDGGEPDAGARTRRDQDDLDRTAAALRPVALRLLTAVADVLAGRRPPGDLGSLLDPHALATLAGAAPPPRARQARQARQAGAGAMPGAPAPRAGLRGLRVCALGPRAAEVVAVVHGPDRVRALAARLERVDCPADPADPPDQGPADPAAPGRWRAVSLWPG